MKAIILAAGYATRLYPLTLDRPKPLLNIGGKLIIERILDQIYAVSKISEIYIVTNHKFKHYFDKWLNDYDNLKPIKVIDDMTGSNEDRLGAIGDIDYVVKKEKIDDELIILAGDTLVDVDLSELSSLMEHKDASVTLSKYMEKDQIKGRYGNLIEDENDFIIAFEEKPENPKSNLASIPFYLLKKEAVQEIRKCLELNPDLDNAGEFIKHLIKFQKVLNYTIKGHYFDIGCREDLNDADIKYGGKGDY